VSEFWSNRSHSSPDIIEYITTTAPPLASLQSRRTYSIKIVVQKEGNRTTLSCAIRDFFKKDLIMLQGGISDTDPGNDPAPDSTFADSPHSDFISF
jgi:hypothetical protein